MLETAYNICENSSKLRFAGYVADRPSPQEKNPRYTMYPEFLMYPELLRIQAEKLEVPMYRDKINGSYLVEQGFSAFQRWLYNKALDRKTGDKKDLNIMFLMACFGPRVTRPTIELARGWFFNSHPNIVGTPWGPKNPFKGPQPYEGMLLARRELEEQRHGKVTDFLCELVAHTIDNKYDNGHRAFGVGNVPLPPYEGRVSYDRLAPICHKVVTCRPREQGQWIHEMHVRMAPVTAELTEKILTNDLIIKSIRDGEWATPKLIRTIFPSKKNEKPPRGRRDKRIIA
jgi:hypothetical protein